MDVKRLWNGRFLIVLSSLVLGLLLFLRNTGVREVHREIDATSDSVTDPQPASDDWPWWRGLASSNVVSTSAPTLRWSASENVAWRTSVPGRGHASPCLWGERIFLSTSDVEHQTISLLCFDKETGLSLWQTELHQGGFVEIHKKNSHASATPASDGRFVYVTSCVNGALWVTAVDFTGRVEWRREAGPYSAEWGYGSSPAIHKSLVIVSADNRGSGVDRLMGSSWLAALHRQTGEIVWRVKRPDGDSFGSPVVAHIADRDQLLLAGKDSVSSYDPTTGGVLWKCHWDAKRAANTVTFDGLHVYASSRHPQSEIICIRADGEGDVTATHLVWREQKSACDVPSPCVHEGRLYSLCDDGVLTCLSAADGNMMWKRRLGGNVSSSPLIAGEHLFCCNEDGTTFVVKLGGRGEVVAENSLGDGIMASPVVSRDRLYIRTSTGLYCFAAPISVPIADEPEESRRRLSLSY